MKNGFVPLEVTEFRGNKIAQRKNPERREFLTGFTIVEILVSFGIIIFLLILVLINYRQNTSQFALSRSAYKLAQDIRRAEGMAMAAKEFLGAVPAGGYGIHFRISWQNFYKLYADTNGNEQYNDGDGEVQTVYLEQGVIIQNVSPSSLSVNFKPPNPTIRMKTEAGSNVPDVVITLALESDPTKTKIITFNAAGLAVVE